MSALSDAFEIADLKKLVSTLQGYIEVLKDQIKSLRENKPDESKEPDVKAPCDCCSKIYIPPQGWITSARDRNIMAHRCAACKKLVCDTCFHKEVREFTFERIGKDPNPFLCAKCEDGGWELIIKMYKDNSGIDTYGARRKSVVEPPKVHEEKEEKKN